MSGPEIPWKERRIRAYVDRLKSGGLVLGNLMMLGFINTLYSKPGRDAEIQKVQQSIRAAGEAGVPAVEDNHFLGGGTLLRLRLPRGLHSGDAPGRPSVVMARNRLEIFES